VWSCLAAHAAVLHLDGIERRRFPEKLSGVFSCARAADHPLVTGMPSSWRMPHSRYNSLDASELLAAGYDVLSSSGDAGPDMIIQQRGALFVFYQGHPEYDPGALFREYRRDVGRYLAGTMDRYPEMPRSYFDDETARALAAFRARAEPRRRRELLDEFPFASSWQPALHAWRDDAVRLYANWLAHVAMHRHSPADAAVDAVPAPTP
jgi:homoserine O-succinyltransferase